METAKNARTLLLLLGLSGLSGCGAEPEASNPGFVPGNRVVMMPMARTRAGGTGHLSYYGGQVMPSVKVVAVYWGPNVSPTTTGGLAGFFTTITNSPYIDWLLEYDTNITAQGGTPGTNQHIGRGSYLKAVTITPQASGGTIDDTQIQAELDRQIGAATLPPPDVDTFYATYFPPGTTITQGGASSCQAFCAYHGTFLHNGTDVVYGVIPDQGGACAGGCANSGDPLGDVTAVTSHEMVESITDAEAGLYNGAAAAGAPLAWLDTVNGEIGDICVGVLDTLSGYVIQKEWSNSLNQCITTNPAVPPPTPTPSPTPSATPPPPTPTPTATPTSPGGNGLVASGKGCGCDLLSGPEGSLSGIVLSLLGLSA